MITHAAALIPTRLLRSDKEHCCTRHP